MFIGVSIKQRLIKLYLHIRFMDFADALILFNEISVDFHFNRTIEEDSFDFIFVGSLSQLVPSLIEVVILFEQ